MTSSPPPPQHPEPFAHDLFEIAKRKEGVLCVVLNEISLSLLRCLKKLD